MRVLGGDDKAEEEVRFITYAPPEMAMKPLLEKISDPFKALAWVGMYRHPHTNHQGRCRLWFLRRQLSRQ